MVDRRVAELVRCGVGIVNDQVVSISPDQAAANQQFRSQVGHISHQSGVFFVGAIFTAGLSYLFKVYVARVLGAHDLGLYALGVTLISFIGIFGNLGLPESAVRFVAQYQATGRSKELHGLLWGGAGVLFAANVILAAVLLICGRFVVIHFYHAPALVGYLPLFAALLVLGMVNSFYGKALTGYHDVKLRTLIVNFIGSPLFMLVGVLLISAGMGLRGYIVAQMVSTAAVCLMLVIAVWRSTPSAARFSAQSSLYPQREVWSFSVAMLAVGLMEFLMSQVDKIALGYYRNPKEVGVYSVAAALVVYVPLALSSVNQIFAPTIADLHTRGEHALLARLFQSLTKWVVGLTLPLALVTIVFAHPLMRIFGHDFEAGWPILVIGATGQLVNCGVGSVGYLLLMSGHQKRLVKVQTIMAAVMVILSFSLIPLWGIVGAALAAALTNVGMNVWNLLEVRTALHLTPYNRSYIRLLPPAIAALAVMIVAKKYSAAFHYDWLAVGTTLALSYVVFAAIVLAVGLDSDDRMIASAIWSRIRIAFAGEAQA
jgi:O-antigen/teichoic acid export membrane protein